MSENCQTNVFGFFLFVIFVYLYPADELPLCDSADEDFEEARHAYAASFFDVCVISKILIAYAPAAACLRPATINGLCFGPHMPPQGFKDPLQGSPRKSLSGLSRF